MRGTEATFIRSSVCLFDYLQQATQVKSSVLMQLSSQSATATPHGQTASEPYVQVTV